jgi:hypothetical protein
VAGDEVDLPLGARLETRADGQVDVFLPPELGFIEEALNDAISSLPPRGAPGNGPSPYWIDVALVGLEAAGRAGEEARPFAAGNATLWRRIGDEVEARWDFDEDEVPGERIAVDDFRALLTAWRDAVVASAGTSTAPFPETYRRNPHARA